MNKHTEEKDRELCCYCSLMQKEYRWTDEMNKYVLFAIQILTLRENRNFQMNTVVLCEKLLKTYGFVKETKTCIHSAALVLYFTDIVQIILLLSFVINKISRKLQPWWTVSSKRKQLGCRMGFPFLASYFINTKACFLLQVHEKQPDERGLIASRAMIWDDKEWFQLMFSDQIHCKGM